AHAPLLVGGEKAAAVQRGQLFVVLLVIVVELLELVVLGGEPADQDFGVGHADLLAGVSMQGQRRVGPATDLRVARDCAPCASGMLRLAIGPPSTPLRPASGLPWYPAYTPALANLSRLRARRSASPPSRLVRLA